MKFFTDITTSASHYCMLCVNQYYSTKKRTKSLIFVDPGVYDLKHSYEYSHITLLHNLAQGFLMPNEYVSIDYPCDMNLQYSDQFIAESIRNNLRYADNPRYICTIQSHFQNFADFQTQFNFLENKINFYHKIVGVGNLCRIMAPNQFTDHVFEFLKTKPAYRYHFYGLGMRLIKKYASFLNSEFISVDSTKWTFAVTDILKKEYGPKCNTSNRNQFFLAYMSELSKFLTVDY